LGRTRFRRVDLALVWFVGERFRLGIGEDLRGFVHQHGDKERLEDLLKSRRRRPQQPVNPQRDDAAEA
jgi:hypothetical protein